MTRRKSLKISRNHPVIHLPGDVHLQQELNPDVTPSSRKSFTDPYNYLLLDSRTADIYHRATPRTRESRPPGRTAPHPPP